MRTEKRIQDGDRDGPGPWDYPKKLCRPPAGFEWAPSLLGSAEAIAVLVDVPASTLLRWAEERLMPAHRLPGRTKPLFSFLEVSMWIALERHRDTSLGRWGGRRVGAGRKPG